ncbi:MAG: RDD family protein [Nanoarchaeota archaeon]|nr:RDD family protein [Nanoarchaeota archaeon]
MVNNYLVNYIKEQLKNGYDINSIREAIAQQEYERGEVEDSINYVYGNAKNITEKESNKTVGINMANPNYRGFWIRFLAYILDGFIIGIPVWVLQIGLIYATGIQSMMYLASLAGVVLIIYMDGIKGGTPGKLILGMRIVNEKGEYIGIPMAILRCIGKVLSGMILCIGYFMIGWDEKKQGLHDKIAQTYVVKV